MAPDAIVVSDEAAHRTRFLAFMRRVPAPVAIIACASEHGSSGLAATSWCSLTADPPMMLACVNRSASAHDLILAAGAFSINVLPEHEDEVCAVFSGQRGLEGADRFLPGLWRPGQLGQPLLTTAIAAFECRLVGQHGYSTHTLLTGAVVAMAPGADGQALLYLEGAYARAHHRG